MPDPTDEQRRVIAELKHVYGRDAVKAHAADAATGLMRVELKSAAGVWNWYYRASGEFAYAHLTGRLFDPPALVHKPRNAIDN